MEFSTKIRPQYCVYKSDENVKIAFPLYSPRISSVFGLRKRKSVQKCSKLHEFFEKFMQTEFGCALFSIFVLEMKDFLKKGVKCRFGPNSPLKQGPKQ